MSDKETKGDSIDSRGLQGAAQGFLEFSGIPMDIWKLQEVLGSFHRNFKRILGTSRVL